MHKGHEHSCTTEDRIETMTTLSQHIHNSAHTGTHKNTHKHTHSTIRSHEVSIAAIVEISFEDIESNEGKEEDDYGTEHHEMN